MAKTNQAFNIYKGEHKTLSIEVLKEDGTALDLTSLHLLYRVTKNVTTKTSQYEAKNDDTHDEIVISGSGNNFANIEFVHDDSDELRPGEYYHELRVIDPVSYVELVVMTGPWNLFDSTTNIVTP